MPRTKGAKDIKPRAKRTDNPIGKLQTPDFQEGYNAKQVQFMMDIRPPYRETENLNELERRFNRYLQICAERDIKVSNQAAYFALGIEKQTASEWAHDTSNKERADFINMVKNVCGMYREQMMADAKINPVVGIFWQKNYDGMRDQQEVVLTPNAPLGAEGDPDTIAERYGEMLEGIEDKQV